MLTTTQGILKLAVIVVDFILMLLVGLVDNTNKGGKLGTVILLAVNIMGVLI